MEEIKYKIQNFCPTCNIVVETGVIYQYDYDVSYEDDDLLVYNGMKVILSKCLNCHKPILTEQKYYNYEDNCSIASTTQLYPITDNIALKNAPEIVNKPYQEALKCYRAHAYDASVIMCRKGIEAICNDKGEVKGSLRDKLKNLNDKKILENTLYNWANELRMIGNDGAHSHDKIVSQQDAKDAIDFFDALITFIYHLVNQYNVLKGRRTSNK